MEQKLLFYRVTILIIKSNIAILFFSGTVALSSLIASSI